MPIIIKMEKKMNFHINPMTFNAVFTIPTEIVDCHLKLAKAEHIKILLYILRNMSEKIDQKNIAEKLNITEFEVNEALLYWADAGILTSSNNKPIKKEKITVTKQDIKPTRLDVAKRGNEDPKLRFLLREAQIKIGRNLKTNESSTLVWLYEDQGLDISLILLIIQYAIQNKKYNIRFIESVAVNWINKGITDITDADNELQKMVISEQAWGIVSQCFGLEKRKPSQKELDLSYKWINEWEISKELLNLAYEECVNNKSKFSFAYISKIIENWHEKGINKPEELEKSNSKNNKNNITYINNNDFKFCITSKYSTSSRRRSNYGIYKRRI